MSLCCMLGMKKTVSTSIDNLGFLSDVDNKSKSSDVPADEQSSTKRKTVQLLMLLSAKMSNNLVRLIRIPPGKVYESRNI